MVTTNLDPEGPAISHRGPLGLHIDESRSRVTQSDHLRGPSTFSLASPPATAKPPPDAKTRGEIEAGVCSGVRRFQQEYMGKGPHEIRAHLVADLLLVRLTGVLTPAERKLVNALDDNKGKNLVMQVRTQLIEAARPVMQSLIENMTGVRMISLHHDLSTATDEEMIVFTLDEPPRCREAMNKRK